MEEREARGGTLILGGGFAGALRRAASGRRRRDDVSHENFMLYTPLLPEAASGTLEPRHTVVPLRVMCPHAELLLGDLRCRPRSADGDGRDRRRAAARALARARARTRRRAAHRARSWAREHALSFKSLPDAINLRNHVLRRLEAADAALDDGRAARAAVVRLRRRRATPGVEALAELSDLVDDAMRYYPRLRDVPRRWVLVDAAPKILPEIPSRLGEYAARELAERGVEIHVGTTLESVRADEAVLGDGTRIPTHTLVWTAGVRANPLLRELGVPLDDRGRVEVDELLRVRGVPGVWALGDCARVPNTRSETPDPPTCQHALRQARRLAKNITGDPKPYGYRMLGQVATLGRYKGIADVVGLRFRGFPGWFVTRSYHLYQLPLAQRRTRVVVDWTVSLLFRRDLAELGMLGKTEDLGA